MWHCIYQVSPASCFSLCFACSSLHSGHPARAASYGLPASSPLLARSPLPLSLSYILAICGCSFLSCGCWCVCGALYFDGNACALLFCLLACLFSSFLGGRRGAEERARGLAARRTNTVPQGSKRAIQFKCLLERSASNLFLYYIARYVHIMDICL